MRPTFLDPHRETKRVLTQEILDAHHTPAAKLSIVLFDEIEKASDTLWNLLLGILDKATLTLGDNSKVDFSGTMIFMTSNVGAREMKSLMKPRLGFAGPAENCDPGDINEPLSVELARGGIEAARRKFAPEFINRIDKMGVFKPLGAADLNRILEIELNSVRQRVLNAHCRPAFHFCRNRVGDLGLRDMARVVGATALSRSVFAAV